MHHDMDDCLIIGAGPAGLTAAIYLGRFLLRVRIVEDAQSRAALIPETHNHAGFPNGIAGSDLLGRMRQQAELHGAMIEHGVVTHLRKRDSIFIASVGTREIKARTLLLATGVVNHRPRMDTAEHDEALSRGLLRYCPICDGYEVTDKRIAVLGTGERGVNEAVFLRSFTADVTLIAPDGPHELSSSDRQRIAESGIALVDGPAEDFAIGRADALTLEAAGSRLSFDSLYPALGSAVRSELAVQVGASTSEEGCLRVDSHQQTTLPGLFAAGDVVLGLDQISHAIGAAGVAAVTIRNLLASSTPLLR